MIVSNVVLNLHESNSFHQQFQGQIKIKDILKLNFYEINKRQHQIQPR